jgi:uncharacterized membrane protein
MTSGKGMADKATEKVTGKVASGLAGGATGLVKAMGKRMLSNAADRVGNVAERLTDHVANGDGSLLSAITGGGSGGSKNKKNSLKVTNIVERIDVGVPVRLAYNQWTQFGDFPSFMKKVESVEQGDDGKLQWRAKIFWSRRSWTSTVIEQVPDRRIIWRSDGAKGSVDGAVTFHELAPELTRILVILQYHPQGLFERTGNLWRAQGRRARLELKHFARHVMTEAVLNQEEIEGWRGEIHDGEVTRSHEDAVQAEKQQEQEKQGKEKRDRQPSGQRAERGQSRPSRPSTSDDRDTRRRQSPPRRSDDAETGRPSRSRASSGRS